MKNREDYIKAFPVGSKVKDSMDVYEVLFHGDEEAVVRFSDNDSRFLEYEVLINDKPVLVKDKPKLTMFYCTGSSPHYYPILRHSKEELYDTWKEVLTKEELEEKYDIKW